MYVDIKEEGARAVLRGAMMINTCTSRDRSEGVVGTIVEDKKVLQIFLSSSASRIYMSNGTKIQKHFERV